MKSARIQFAVLCLLQAGLAYSQFQEYCPKVMSQTIERPLVEGGWYHVQSSPGRGDLPTPKCGHTYITFQGGQSNFKFDRNLNGIFKICRIFKNL